MLADDYDLRDLGVLVEGGFDTHGDLHHWHLIHEIGDELPRWLLDQPVLTVGIKFTDGVYVRGMYSERLSRKRRAAMSRPARAVDAGVKSHGWAL